MDCKQAKTLLAPHILGDLDNEPSRCKELQAHLLCCPNCAEMYDGVKETVGFVLAHKAEFAQAFENARAREKKIDVPIPSPASFPGIRKIFIKASAVAACLVTGVFIWLAFSHYSKSHILPQTSSSEQVASAPKPSVKIELVSKSGNIAIPTGKKIVSGYELKTLLINSRHRMMMNAGTSLSIEPMSANAQLGCLVKLTAGRIHGHVESDGKPFEVLTSNSRSVITGTTFDIEVQDQSTTLIVSEGSVRFESEKGVVQVTAGRTSTIVAQSAPTRPVSCNATELTAWATGHELRTTLPKIGSHSDTFDLSDLWLSAISGPVDLESINYQEWIEEKRPWFEREFPWIFQLQSALAQEGVKVDYPDLLLQTGDIWQFAYPQVSYRQIPVLTFDSLLAASSKYGFDEQWLLENIPSTKSLPDMPKEILTGQNAFRQWVDSFEKLRNTTNTPDSGTLLYSLHATTYLVNTRALAWLCIANAKTDVSTENRAQILAFLQTEVNTANKLSEHIIRLFVASENRPCEEFNVLIEKVIDNLAVMMDIEERVSKYEIGK